MGKKYSFEVTTDTGSYNHITQLEVSEHLIEVHNLDKRVRAMIDILEGKLFFAGHMESKIKRAEKLIEKCEKAGRTDLADKLRDTIARVTPKKITVPSAMNVDQKWFDSIMAKAP